MCEIIGINSTGCCSCAIAIHGPEIIFDQGLVDMDQIFNQDHDRDENFSIMVCLKKNNQSLPENFQSRCGCKK
jgi:hypothetical protein